MGHGQSCTRPKLRNYNGDGNKEGLFSAIENGDVGMVRSMVERDLMIGMGVCYFAERSCCWATVNEEEAFQAFVEVPDLLELL
ncbi:hypothetical protein Droror1_Dr00016973 [Drosera rotundifolia]